MARGRGREATAALTLVASLAAALTAASGVATAASRAPGTVTPPPGSGINTPAALGDPRCDQDAGPYGRWSFVTVGSGPVCVRPFGKGERNGGATARGVTAKTITIVAVTQNPEQTALQKQQGGTPPTNNSTGQTGTMEDALHDLFAAYEHAYETWGRAINLEYVQSSGSDEASQRADALRVESYKPFAVLETTPTGLPVLTAKVAQDGYVVMSNTTTTDNALRQQPYRWGQADQVAVAVNAGEFVGKQLVGHDAEYAGDPSLRTTKRKLGVVYPPAVFDVKKWFLPQVEKRGGTVAPNAILEYTSNGTTVGDPTAAEEQAPTIVAKLKDLGVTSVVMFTDVEMGKAMTAQATKLDYHPEWIIAGYQYQDLAILARGYDQDQWTHAFGISNLFPYVKPSSANAASALDAVQWYYGRGNGTSSIPGGAYVAWVMAGIQYAGPRLTPRTFRQGLFSVPAQGGAASGQPLGFQTGYGRTVGLPYDEYLALGTDFAPVWWDSQIGDAYSQIFASQAKGGEWYVNGAKRYKAGQWPTKHLTFFDKASAIQVFDTSPIAATAPNPCTGCPSEGGPGTPGAA
ncbi:MAG TPA: ABC transporter substrate-binding protein [Acidimicrobiia bacterium]|nr:ABC transporter substrate-binding protein [Acidimicrobiia bacterium]